MTTQESIYQRYLNQPQFKNNPNFAWVNNIDLKNADCFSYANKVGNAGVYKLPDGKIADCKEEFGWFRKYAIFENLNDWQRYIKPMSMSQYFEY